MSRIKRAGATAKTRPPIGAAAPSGVGASAPDDPLAQRTSDHGMSDHAMSDHAMSDQETSAQAPSAEGSADQETPAAYVTVVEAPLRGMLSLRADLAEPAVAAAVQAATGLSPPDRLRCRTDGERGVYWMSPDELLLCAPYAEIDAAYDAAAAAMGDRPHLLADVSDARQILSISGAGAREVLAKGMSIDLHPSAFGLGDFRRSALAHVAAAAALVGDAPDRFELFCHRSYAMYVHRWLLASSAKDAEIGLLRR